MDFRKSSTETIENIIKTAKENMPKEATHMKIYDGDRCYINEFGILTHYTGTDCVYYNDNMSEYGFYEKVGHLEINNCGSWEESYSANYVLYNEGLYRPYSDENLKSIKGRYEIMLDYGIIYPINGLYSDEYKCKMFCKNIIENHKDSLVKLIFVQDYDYCENREDRLKGNKEYSIRAKIVCDGLEYLSDCDWDTGIWIMLDQAKTELVKNGVSNVVVEYDMTDEDMERLTRHHNWGGLSWDNF